jgi:hypothetical protein
MATTTTGAYHGATKERKAGAESAAATALLREAGGRLNRFSDRAYQEAQVLAADGLAVFPCNSHKHPRCEGGYTAATTDPAAIAALWAACPGPLVGVATGAVSGLDVLDIDPRNGGQDWLHKHQEDLPRTRTHETAGGGAHLLFNHAPGLRCSLSRIAPGVDVKADGGYLIWYPAVDPAHWPWPAVAPRQLKIQHAERLAPWPEWLLEKAKPKPPSPIVAGGVVPSQSRIKGLLRLVASAQTGKRNAALFWAACRFGEMCRSGLISEATARSLLVEAASRAGLAPDEAERTAHSGLGAGGG